MLSTIPEHGNNAPRFAWKFLLPGEGVTVVIAPDETAARQLVLEHARALGLDISWLRAAQVFRFDVHANAVLCWAQR